MGCGDGRPIYPGKRYIDWDLPDPPDFSSVRDSAAQVALSVWMSRIVFRVALPTGRGPPAECLVAAQAIQKAR
jgi:hypothetical protein